MPNLKNFTAWIEMDGVPLPEYHVETHPNGQTVTCWIASEEGKNFEVHWRDNLFPTETRGTVAVDGKHAAGKLLSPSRHENKARVVGMRTSETTRAKFQFGRTMVTDDESLEVEDETTLKALGTIELRIVSGSSRPVDFTSPRKLEQKPVHEGTKKAGVHRVTLGEPVDDAKPNRRYFTSDGSPPIQFSFRYASRDMLRARGIIPFNQNRGRRRPVMHCKVEVLDDEERDDEGESEGENEELDELEARLVALQQRVRAARKHLNKRPYDGSDDRKSKRVKTEEINARAAFRPGEVIDLT